MKKHSLGKGLTTVYDIIQFSKHIEALDPQEITMLELISLSRIIPNRYQIRKKIDNDGLQQLAESIIQKGIINPLLVRVVDDKYEIVAGERRWLAAQLAGLIEVPAVICNIDEQLSFSYSLVENLQREDLNIIDKANAFWRMQQEFKLTHEQIAKQVSYSRVAVTNILRLLSLPELVKDMLQDNKLDLGHARALVGLSYQQQEILAKKIVAHNMTVREVENLVQKLKNNEVKVKSVPAINTHLKNNPIYSEQLSQKLLSNVKVKLNPHGIGKIIIDIDSAEYLEWLLENLIVKN